MNIPDRWVVVKINFKDQTIYKVFGVWYGGYLGSNYWQFNSGIASVEVREKAVLFHGNSGSQYLCNSNSYGLGGWGTSELDHLIKGAESAGAKVEVLPASTDWRSLV